MSNNKNRILYVVNVDWFFISHRLPLALEAKNRGYDVIIATTNTGRFNELESLGFQLFDLKIERSGTNPFKEIILIIKIIRILKEINPTIVHNVTLKMSIYCSIATRFASGIKVINAISGLGYNFTADRITGAQRIINILMKCAFNHRGFSFIFQNSDDLQLFQKQKLEAGNKFYIIKGVGVDLAKFIFLERKIKDTISFILTARMLKDKGISEFIKASKIVLKRYPGVKFRLVGGIDPENPASFTENELNNELSGTTITWLGHRNDITELLLDSDVMVFPSYREGLPKSLIEAAAASLPIITTDTVGCRDCVDDGLNGFLVPPGDSNILAEKMFELLENPGLRQKMGRASRIKAENEFSLDLIIEKTFELYN
jgi:glycosyltransferase involved in cell wall biosynthesis